jgi:hypothetical protein
VERAVEKSELVRSFEQQHEWKIEEHFRHRLCLAGAPERVEDGTEFLSEQWFRRIETEHTTPIQAVPIDPGLKTFVERVGQVATILVADGK